MTKKVSMPSSQDEILEQEPEMVETKPSQTLQIPLSQSLIRKLTSKAQSEGVSMEELAGELLAEGLVLRAWEIMERKNTMRKSSAPNSSGPNNNNNKGANRNFGKNNQPNNRRQSLIPRRPANYNNIIEDSANFIDYVRKQEKSQSKKY